MFGSWRDDPGGLKERYIQAHPFEHVVINNFFTDEFAEKLYENLPDPDDTWWAYDNPFEQKFLKTEFDSDVVRELFKTLNSTDFARVMSQVTGIGDLEPDPHLHSAGVHAYPRNGKIDIHLDYTIHPKSGRERRVSLMIYMTKDWKPEYKGRLELWDRDIKTCTPVECSMWNTGIVFKTSEDAYHAVESVMCPKGTFRKVIGLYYLTEPRLETLERPRYSAELFPRPGQVIPPKLQKLYATRRNRRLTPVDLEDWPNWREECGLNE